MSNSHYGIFNKINQLKIKNFNFVVFDRNHCGFDQKWSKIIMMHNTKNKSNLQSFDLEAIP